MKYSITALFLLLYLQVFPQNPYYINYSIADGLPSNNVYSVLQDESGLIWFTTDVGIVKYDSKSFKLYNTDDGLSDNEVFKLSRDRKGRMWMHTLNGKPCILYNDRIYNEHNLPLLQKIRGSGLVVDFYEDDNKNIYIGFRSGEIYIIDSLDNISRKTNFSTHWGVWKDSLVYTIHTDVVTRLDNGDTVQILHTDRNKTNYLSCRMIHIGKQNYFSASNTVFAFSGGRFTPVINMPDVVDITNVCQTDNNLWIATRSGLYQYSDKKLTNKYFENDIISDLLRDREGNYWITTLNRGVLFVPSMSVLRMLDNKKIQRLASDGNKLWLGGAANDYYTMKGGSVSSYHLPAEWIENKISCFRFYKGNIYIGAKSGLLVQESGKITHYRVNVNDLLFNQDEIFIANTYTARLPIRRIKKDIVHTPDQDKILNKRTNVLATDDSGNVWIGTNFGLYLYASEQGGYKLYNIGEQYEELAISIEDIYFDPAQKLLLIGTASKGVIVVKDRKIQQVIKTKNGLNNNTVTVLKKIGDNEYLIGTNNGLNKVKLYDHSALVENHNFMAGLNNKRVNDIELLCDTVYLATDDGVMYFGLSALNKSNIYPTCNITAVKTSKGPVIGSQLSYGDNDISISFNGISFKDKGDVEYYYRFAGRDNEWNTTRETQVNYKDLAPGVYTFELYCKNGVGNRSNTVKTYFEILPPFWQRKWFIILCIIALATAIYLYFRLRIKKIQIQNDAEKRIMQAENERVQLEKHMLELEQKALRMQMNPHFIFNALNTIKGYYAEGEDDKAGNYIAKFSKLLRSLLNTEGQNTTLDNEIEMLRLYMELTRIRYHDKFNYTINIGTGLMPADTLIPSLLLQPIVENAIIHGLASKQGDGNLTVTFKKEGDEMTCMVEDNGIGRKKAAMMDTRKLHDSKAISIVRDRLKLFSDTAYFAIIDLEENGMASGTRVIIKLPIKYTGF